VKKYAGFLQAQGDNSRGEISTKLSAELINGKTLIKMRGKFVHTKREFIM
jgi:hypothetical protein